jgi:hypothetical protein
MSDLIKLNEKHGRLYAGENMLLTTNTYGEPDWPNYPNPDSKVLAICLYDAREMGHIPLDAMQVELPNGEVFTIDEHGI